MDSKVVNYVIETTFNTNLLKKRRFKKELIMIIVVANIISMLNFKSITYSIKKQEKYILELLVRHLSYINHIHKNCNECYHIYYYHRHIVIRVFINQ